MKASEVKSRKLTLRSGGLLLLAVSVLLSSSTVFAKKVQFRKTQEVDFDASDIDGVARNPDGAYLVQKRGIDFMPLYKVRQNFDESIRESVDYLKSDR